MSKLYSINEVFKILGEENLNKTDTLIKSESIKIDGYLVYIDSWRYRTFYQKGTKCACCGKEAKYFKLKPDSSNPERAHFNLYSEDGMLFTKDHIIPKSVGGKDCIENFQTYCEECNRTKDNKLPDDVPEELRKVIIPPKNEIQAENVQTKEIKQFINIEQAARWLCHQKINTNNINSKDLINRVVKTTIKLSIAIESETDYYGYKWSRI